MQNHRYRY